MKYLGLSILALAFFLFFPFQASAATCTPIYGGGQTCTNNTLSIQKEVLNPKTNLFVHDLGLSDPMYHGNDLVTFQITVNNTSNNPIQHVLVKDNIPSQLTFTDGPGKFNPNTHTLTFQVNNLVAHHSEVFTISTTVISQSQFPQDQNPFCMSNQVSATPSTGAIVQDSSQLCVEKITSTPSTGPEAIELVALLPTALLGIGIKRFSK